MLRAKAFMARALLTAAVVVAAAPASGQNAVPIITPTMPNYVGFGLGVTTDYIGADDYYFGGLPLGRFQFEGSDRYASLVGTFVDLSLINHPIIRFGPTAQLRLGRSNVSDRAVRRLPSIGKTIEAGVFGGLELIAPDDPRKRLRLDLRVQQDLVSEHEGVAREQRRTGLVSDRAAGGGRTRARHDLWQRRLHGAFFMRLVGDADDCPIVDHAGSPNQISGGLGVAYAWCTSPVRHGSRATESEAMRRRPVCSCRSARGLCPELYMWIGSGLRRLKATKATGSRL